MLSLSAHYLYPVRMRVVNDVTGAVEWHTIAFVPFVRTEQEANAKVKGRARRCGVLQRTLYLALREAIGASHMGTELDEPIHGFKRAFFRVLLYCCDRMEERSVLCLKSGMCDFPCSNCTVSKENLSKPEALDAPERRAIRTLQRQIELAAGAIGNRLVDRSRRAAFKAMDSYHAFIPALACMAGLATPPNHMYQMIAFDALHVRSFLVLCWSAVSRCSACGGSCIAAVAGRERAWPWRPPDPQWSATQWCDDADTIRMSLHRRPPLSVDCPPWSLGASLPLLSTNVCRCWTLG